MIYVDKLKDSVIYYRDKTDFGTGEPSLVFDEIIYTQSPFIMQEYTARGYNVYLLSDLLNLPAYMGLYEIYSFFFEGRITSDFDMLDIITVGLINDSDYIFCLKVKATFCFFSATNDGIKKLGTLQFSDIISRYTVGRFMKRVRYTVASLGYNVKKLKYLCWDVDDIPLEFSQYMEGFDSFSDFFSNISGLSGLSCQHVIRLLTDKHITNVTAESFVDSLAMSFNKLNIVVKDGILYCNNLKYSKDYSRVISPIIDITKCSIGIILDCEGDSSGVLTNGCSHIGGIIYCRYKDTVFNLDTFMCDRLLLNETILQVIENIRSQVGLIHYINVITFGTSDKLMFNAEIQKTASKKVIKQISSILKFTDSKQFIKSYLQTEKIELNNGVSLQNIADYVGVACLHPLHNPINDARTLFNILAKILQVTGDFVV